MTLLMVTHEMSFARKVSDRVVFMHAGRIHEIGPPTQIFGAPQTAETLSEPSSNTSRPLMQRSSVLFPEPLLPMMAMTSPTATSRSVPTKP